MDIDALVNDYLSNKKDKYKATQRSFIYRFYNFLFGKDIRDVRPKDALEYQGWLIRLGKKDGSKYSASSISNHIVSVSGFYDYLKSRDIVLENPFKSIKRLRIDRKIPRNILNETDMSLLLNYFRSWDKGANLKEKVSLYKMHVISELMYSTGLRIFEVANLKLDDIDLQNRIVFVREGKGGFPRRAILNDYTRDILNIYINKIRDLIFTENNKLNGDSLFGLRESSFEKSVNKSLSIATSTLKLNKMTSHGFRHAVGYHLLRSGCDIRHIQDILGHKRLRNTEIYTKVDKKDLKRVFDQSHPRKIKRISHEVNN